MRTTRKCVKSSSSSLVSTWDRTSTFFLCKLFSSSKLLIFYSPYYALKQIALLRFQCGGTCSPGEVPGSKSDGIRKEKEGEEGG